jgi:hypothetical protein
MSPRQRRFLGIFEILTVGFPFCAFKAITGRLLLAQGAPAPLGWALLALAGVDGALNLAGLLALLTGRKSALGVCAVQQAIMLVRPGKPHSRDLGLALDMLLAFALVAGVIGFGYIPRLPHADLHAWNVAVVLNVLGAGLGRLTETLLAMRRAGGPDAPTGL